MADTTVSKWRGLGVPLSQGSSGNLTPKTTKALVKSSLLCILSTTIGTRLMRPTFGSVFNEILFEPNDQVLYNKIKTYIPKAIAAWEPRLYGLSISSSVDGKTVNITISGIIRETGDPIDAYLTFTRYKQSSLKLVDKNGQ